ncbi:hypothetical protein [Limnoglobus roseus]|uniref:Uncharacterized protein n=1 Tax=Limnoglobus roseus TaxID=2598579 RepID=A0A5C1A6R8_9BACT|nr:hypothetical protein [Limnoglobus roseus]QEL14450.1 hypothetical protein PX52LOC_01338 [Limnoglobus roseus]
MKKAAELQKKNQEKADAKKRRIPEIATLWNNQIKPLVSAVEALRNKNPGKAGINAGTNSNVIPAGGGAATTVTIVGGTNNPLTLTLPSDAAGLGISKADVLPTINGWKGSDSGCYKFERGDKIFIHCK